MPGSPKKPKSWSGGERRKPVLLVQHAPHEHPAVLRRALETQGIVTQWIHPYRGESYPDPSEIAGIISLGGPMGANDEAEHPWILPECDLLRRASSMGMPIVGVCLGGQMLARALGAKVERHITAEVGWFPIRLNDEGKRDPVLGVAGPNPTVYHWHEDTFQLPPGAVLLAESKHCERQAYRIGERIYGFQFHPEADHQLIHEWLSIEGIEDDVAIVQKRHGTRTVQDLETQRNHALKGEKSSLKIAAAIGSLFSRRPAGDAPAQLHEQLEEWLTHRTLLVVEFEGSNRKSMHLKGTIMTCLNLSVGDYVIFQEQNTLLWPIRMGDIRKISPSA